MSMLFKRYVSQPVDCTCIVLWNKIAEAPPIRQSARYVVGMYNRFVSKGFEKFEEMTQTSRNPEKNSFINRFKKELDEEMKALKESEGWKKLQDKDKKS